MAPGLMTGDDFSRNVYADAERFVAGVAHSLVTRYGTVLDKGS